MNVQIKNKQPLNIILWMICVVLFFLFPVIILGTGFRQQPLWVHLLWAGLVVFWMVDSYLSYQTIKNLKPESIDHSPFHMGEVGIVNLDVGTGKSYPMSWFCASAKKRNNDNNIMALKIDEKNPYQLDGGQKNIVAQINLTALNRGWNKYPDIILNTSFPFGLTRSMKIIRVMDDFLVYPEIEKNAPPVPMEAKRPVSRKNDNGEEVFSWREYKKGDRIASVDWKKSARMGVTAVREYMDEEMVVSLSWDMVSHMEKEKAISRLTAWIVDIEKKGVYWSLDLPEKYIDIGQGKKQLHLCLRELALL